MSMLRSSIKSALQFPFIFICNTNDGRTLAFPLAFIYHSKMQILLLTTYHFYQNRMHYSSMEYQLMGECMGER